MKICMVSDLYFPEPGGIAEHIFNLARELRRRGHRVLVLTTAVDSGSRTALGPESDDEEFVRRIGRPFTIRANRSVSRIAIGYRVGRQVEELLDAERPDIVHIHGSLAPTLPLASLKASRSVNVATFHAGHEKSTGYQLFQGYLQGYFDRLHGRIAVSQTARRSMADYFPGDYRIIPNGIDTHFFHPGVKSLPEFAEARSRVMFLGRFDPRKGLKHLLRALPLVKKRVPDLQCLVVGSDPTGIEKHRNELDPAVAGDVVFAGSIPGNLRPRYYASTDVFCAPSTGNESFGIILLEAMATGKPVVASDIEGYREVLRDGVEGLLAPPEDLTGIADRLIRILKDRKLAKAMGSAGRARALSFAWPKVTDQVEAYYEELTAGYGKLLPAYGIETTGKHGSART